MSTTTRPWWACTGDPCTCPKPTQARDVLTDVVAERARQDAKWGEQNHPDGTGPDKAWPLGTITRHEARDFIQAATDLAATVGGVNWGLILIEEVAEALAEDDPAKLRAELVQVAAVAVQWVQAIDRRQP